MKTIHIISKLFILVERKNGCVTKGEASGMLFFLTFFQSSKQERDERCIV